ncbi:ROK family protein [Nocardia sp. NPDC005978]|uniref:ROK family protein n=1 Tax=Nocardia sp. NPDC005978 TaxID=3156725 RepID=UPI0033AF20B7
MTILALEIGPSRFAVGRISETEGTQQMRVIAPPTRDVWAACRDLLIEVAGNDRITAVGIGASGPIDMAAGIIASAAIPEWRTGFAIAAAVREVFPHCVVMLALDGACHAMAESNLGSTRGELDTLTVHVSARVTGGLTVGGLTVVGRTGNAGHIGHVLVPGFDDICECGGHGCLEAVAGGTAMVRWSRARGWGGSSESALIDAAEAGDPTALAALERAGTALGRAIVSVAAVLDVGLVVVGGTVADAGSALWSPLGRAISDRARLGFLSGLRVVRSELGEDAILVGAGLIAVAVKASSQ